MTYWKSVLALLSLPVFELLLSGQNLDRASLGGKVTDEKGGVLVGVALTLKNEEAGNDLRSQSSGAGDFLFPFVHRGTYSLTAERTGFKRLKIEGIQLVANERRDVSLVLGLGPLESEVTVTAETSALDTASSAIRTVISEKELVDLPILTSSAQGLFRSPTDTLVALIPGASSSGGRITADTVSINGSSPRSLGFTLDGVDYSDHNGPYETHLISRGPSPDVIGEFSVVTNTFKAEAGSHPVIISFSTKSGGNRFHGQLRTLVLDPALSSRDFFDVSKKSESAVHSLGAQLSGPIWVPKVYQGEDKTFFMLDLEKIYQRSESTGFATVLTDAQRIGDFSTFGPDSWPKDPLTGQAFPGGRMPSNRILPQSRFFVDEFIPKATRDNQWIRTQRRTIQATQFTARIDHQISSANQLNASVFFGPSRSRGTLPNIEQAEFGGHIRTQNIALHYTGTLSPRAVNVLTFGKSSAGTDVEGFGKFDNVDPRSRGFNIHNPDSGYTGIPSVLMFFTNYFSPPGIKFNTRTRVWSVKDNLSIQRDTHSFKLGWDNRWVRTNSLFPLFTPSFQFAGFNSFGTGNEVADLLLGIPFSYSQATAGGNQPLSSVTSVFAQDDYRLRSNLMLNLGLRYEIHGVTTEKEGRFSLFRVGARSQVFPNAPMGMIFPGDKDPLTGNTLRSYNPPDHNNVAPRIGLAYSPEASSGLSRWLLGSSGQSAVRLGYGVFYMAELQLPVFSGGFSAPWVIFANRNATQLKESGGTFANPWGSGPDPFVQPLKNRGISGPGGGLSPEATLPELYQHQWTLSVQRKLPRDFVVELAYVGNRALRLQRQYEINRSPLTPDASLSNISERRKYPEYASIRGISADGTSSYNALQLMVSRRIGSRFQMNGHYVWSKSLTNADGSFWGYAPDRNVSSWARSSTDRRHAGVWNGFVELPSVFAKTRLGKIVSGWKASSIVQARTGAPLNFRNAVDSTLQGLLNEYPTPDMIGTFRRFNPRDVQTFALPNGQTTTGNFLFDPTAFRTVLPQRPEDARVGNLGRNVFSGPGMMLVDFSLLKRFRVTEEQSVEFRIDSTNVFNHAIFKAPGASTGDADFGRTISTYGPRQFQFYLRYSF